jgi:hypothetical protein
VALAVVAVPALWLPLLTLGRWFPEQDGDLVATGRLVAALTGWLATMAVAAAVAALVSRRATRAPVSDGPGAAGPH